MGTNAEGSDVFSKMGKGVVIAEQERDRTRHSGFVADIFRGTPHFEDIFPWVARDEKDERKEARLIARTKAFLKKLSPEMARAEKDITEEVIKEMAKLGLFRLKVPEALGGLGLSQTSYTHVVGYLSVVSPSLAIMVSADNTIGAKYPVLHFGTPEQKAEYLPSLMEWPSAFCFTEKLVGSDPARMRTCAVRRYDYSAEKNGGVAGYEIHGEKWYATNSVWKDGEPLAKYLAVIARIVDSLEEIDNSKAAPCFGAFIVPNDGSELITRAVPTQRTHFIGMKGIFNGVLRFDGVFVPKSALIGAEGDGFKIALQALNTGRISIAGICAENTAKCYEILRWWGKERVQWGRPIGEHELIGSGMIVPAAAHALAMEAMTDYAAGLVDRGEDARLAAAVAKVAVSEQAWKIMDDTVQMRGGRGYELSNSLGKREEAPPVDRMFVDMRPHRIFEGSTEILALWTAREGLDDYLARGKPFLEHGRWLHKASAALGFAVEYAHLLVPLEVPQWLPKAAEKDLFFVEKHARKLARAILLCSGKYQAKMAVKQLTNARLFWIAADLFGMSVTWSLALSGRSRFFGATSLSCELAGMYCAIARRRIKANFASLWGNDDDRARALAKKLLA